MRSVEGPGMGTAESGEGRRIVGGGLLGIAAASGEQMPGHHGSAGGDSHALQKTTRRDFAFHSQFGVVHRGFVLLGVGFRASAYGYWLSAFLTASSAPWKPMRLWVPSQKGLLTEPPQRQRENAGLPVRSYGVPLASTSSTVPSGASTRKGPLGRTVIFTCAIV